MSGLKLFNSLSRKVEEFQPQDPQHVKIYTCGPTVYSDPHIGNYTAYVYWDLLVRILGANGFESDRVLNLTDVGHLTSDGDDGEDKLEKGARKSGKSVWEVAEFYIEEFKRGFTSLKLTEPRVWARATDYIDQDMALVDLLTEKGYTYETRDGIYYDTSKFPRYADFARLDLDGLQAGARVEMSSEKKNPTDFALWKFIQPSENHAMRWDYRGRPGYPGWHLECSTIIHAELGEPIDVHTGGIDHIPVHHTNEIAQSEAAFAQQLARFWLHCNHLTSEGQKLSKSLGNGYSLADLEQKGYDPLDFKMWVFQGHYRSERDFSFEALEAARVRRLGWRNRVALARQGGENGEAEFENAFAAIVDAANQDLNSPQAFALIDGSAAAKLEFWQKVEQLFGLGLLGDAEPGEEEMRLLAERKAARAAKDYQKSDQLRDELKRRGFGVLDAADGRQFWNYLR